MQQDIVSVTNVSKIFYWPKSVSFGKSSFLHFLNYFLKKKRSIKRDGFYALKNLNFSIKKGESVGIIGLNGSGKSTLLQLLAGTMQPTKGKISVKGKVAALLELGCGFEPQFTGRENVYLNASLLGLCRSDIANNFKSIEMFADIGDYIDQPIKTYSSGMRLRLAFAIIVFVNPDILIIDEALAVGDASFAKKCYEFLRRYQLSNSLIFVSHDIDSVKNLCKKCIWIDEGNIRSIGPVKEVCQDYFNFLIGCNGIAKTSHISEIPKPTDHISDLELGEVISGDLVSKDISIEKCSLIDNQNNKEILFVKGHQNVTLVIKSRFHKSIKKPIFGFYIRDRFGQDLIGDNTGNRYLTFKSEIMPNDCVEASFSFITPRLSSGEYGITIAIAEGDINSHKFHLWMNDILQIKVTGLPPPALVGLPMDINLKLTG